MRSSGKAHRPIARADEAFTPVVLLIGIYLAILLGGGAATRAAGWHDAEQWLGLLAVLVATGVTIAIVDRGGWPLGLAIPPRDAARSLLGGLAFAAAIVASAHLAILATTGARHAPGGGIAPFELLTIFLPAAVHEELLFRGYAFQRLAAWKPFPAVAISATLFGVVHHGNAAASALSIANIALAGVMLSLAYLVARDLWFPISLHLFWNLISGPILGHEVSGYVPRGALARVVDRGPALLTGGDFGLEGSLWATVAQSVAIVILARRLRRNGVENAVVVQ